MLRRERIYFLLLALASAVVLYLVTVTGIGVFILLGIAGTLWVLNAIVMGYVRGNAVRVGTDQFPEVQAIAVEASERLGLKQVPQVWVLQTGRIQAELTRRFARRHYIIVTNEIAELASEAAPAPDALRFLLAHEFVRATRQLPLWGALLAPGRLFPFIAGAYFRASTTTCDRVAAQAVPEGVIPGLKVMAAGPDLFRHADGGAITRQAASGGFWRWSHEVLSNTPHTVRRFARVSDLQGDTSRGAGGGSSLVTVPRRGWERYLAGVLLAAAPVLAALTLSSVGQSLNGAISDGWESSGASTIASDFAASSEPVDDDVTYYDECPAGTYDGGDGYCYDD